MNYDEMMQGVDSAKQTMGLARQAARKIAPILVGNLHHCDGDTLVALKKELRKFNIHTRYWNQP